jgi:hypothetical protein
MSKIHFQKLNPFCAPSEEVVVIGCDFEPIGTLTNKRNGDWQMLTIDIPEREIFRCPDWIEGIRQVDRLAWSKASY